MSDSPYLIDLADASFSFSLASETLFDQFSFCIAPGEWVFILGDNGSGKSTFLDLLYGQKSWTSCQLRIDGQDIDKWTIRQAWKKGFVHLGQAPQTSSLTLGEYASLGLESRRDLWRPFRRDALDFSSLWQRWDSSRRLGDLSLEEFFVFRFAWAIQKGTRLLLLDELGSFLLHEDALSVRELLQSYRLQGGSIIMVTHDERDLLSSADAYYYLESKQLHSLEEHEAHQKLRVFRDIERPLIREADQIQVPQVLWHMQECRYSPQQAPLDLKIYPGEFVSLVFPREKEDLEAVLRGLRKPLSGRIFLEGHDITEENFSQRRRRALGYLLPWEESSLPWLWHQEAWKLSEASPWDYGSFWHAYWQKGGRRSWQTFSGGERRLLSLRRELAYAHRVLLLSSLSRHFDRQRLLEAFSWIEDFLQQGGCVLHWSQHDVEARAFSQRVATFDSQGHIFWESL